MATTGSADLTAAIGTSTGELAEHSLRRLNGTQVTRRMAMRALADLSAPGTGMLERWIRASARQGRLLRALADMRTAGAPPSVPPDRPPDVAKGAPLNLWGAPFVMPHWLTPPNQSTKPQPEQEPGRTIQKANHNQQDHQRREPPSTTVPSTRSCRKGHVLTCGTASSSGRFDSSCSGLPIGGPTMSTTPARMGVRQVSGRPGGPRRPACGGRPDRRCRRHRGPEPGDGHARCARDSSAAGQERWGRRSPRSGTST